MEKDLFLKLPEFSPDQFLLEEMETHLLFTCAGVPVDTTPIQDAVTVERMTLWRQSNQAIPLRMSGQPRAKLRGVLHVVTTENVITLDKKLQNGVFFERTAIPILVPIQSESGDFSHIPAPVWIYMGKLDYWEDRIRWDQQNSRCGQHNINSEFELARTYPHTKPVLHHSFSFHEPPAEQHLRPSVTGHKEVAEHCGRKNKYELSYRRKLNDIWKALKKRVSK